MYNSSTQSSPPPRDASKYVKVGIIVLIAIVIFVLTSNQAVVMYMNSQEFGTLFTKPLYFSLLSAVVLASIALIRVNIKNRSSMSWYAINTILTFFKRGANYSVTETIPSFKDYKLNVPNFIIWQITKVVLFGAFFTNLMFGFALVYLVDGHSLGINSIWNIFSLPFVTPPTDPSYATTHVVPMIPSLTILVPPILAVIGLRLVLYVGLHNIVGLVTRYLQDAAKGKPKVLDYISTVEAIIGIGIIWAGINMFFTNQIDYNTRYAIGGTLAAGLALVAFYFIDKFKSRVIIFPSKRDIYIRILVLVIIALVAGSIMMVNNSIADARKIEFLGPYKAEQIGVNRYLGQLDQITVVPDNVKLSSVAPSDIPNYVAQNNALLDKVRVWDWDAAFAKLKPEIGLIPYVNFENNDILRFNDTLYWTASMKPILPDSVTQENQWYNQHFVYTHVDNGFLTLNAQNGTIVDSNKFFKQRMIYYGEGGLFSETWAAYPQNRQTSAELNNATYNGTGGIEVKPPISQLFEPNFFLSYPTEPMHILRYRDVHDRMQLLYPYFQYNLLGKQLDILPVSNGQKTYWLVPLIVGFDTGNVPWSFSNPYLRLVGYALVDIYNGKVTLIKTGDDFFTDMFASQYHDQFIDMPSWLGKQLKYPEALFNWKVEMFNIYHVTDPSTFIQAKDFYEVPNGLGTYYVEEKPPGFDKLTYVGLLSLELRGSQGRNLAGYMIVQNDVSNLGKMQFYQVPLDSKTKLLGPTAVREALSRESAFAQLQTLLRTPRVGDNILYRIGNQDVYFIPVYTAGSGGVVTQLGTIAAVGAAFDGEYFVGLGNTPQEAFAAYLAKVSGVAPDTITAALQLDESTRISTIKTILGDQKITILTPMSIQFPLTFEEGKVSFIQQSDLGNTKNLISEFVKNFVQQNNNKILFWQENGTVKLGAVTVDNSVPELHYITIGVR
ncbi:UPF0182 family protein [Candidatus Nitrosotalea okcheonensis]|uniref:Uncharacterized protein n=1 Tax=Candidatus Nitrosotalea okcheonensis TaxID=1903276 RepID=A0A2H1FHC9_9ARCH|nr:UPF0182 family protein [Candidatus Nitrosotalea okcheonensis]SMH72168.1 conserved membrane protein of unknown function [Candidatus Nitrosotalea okcheonensis]